MSDVLDDVLAQIKAAIAPGATLYHGTTRDKVDSIKANGLVPRYAAGCDVAAERRGADISPTLAHDCVYLSARPETAAAFAWFAAKAYHLEPCVVEVDAHGLTIERDELSHPLMGAYRVSEPIAPCHIIDVIPADPHQKNEILWRD